MNRLKTGYRMAAVWTAFHVPVMLGAPAFADGDLSFAPAVNYAVGAQPTHLVAGDFNADDRLDLVSSNVAGYNVSVLLGGSMGTFQSAVNYPVSQPRGMAAGHFNGDGRTDLAVTSINPGTLRIFMADPVGTLQFGGSHSVSGPDSIAAADLNDDSVLDLVMTQPIGPLAVLIGHGDGTFHAPAYYATPPTREVAIGDFNGDAIPDLAVTTYNGTTVLILRGNGNGTFQPAMSFFAGGLSGSHTIGIAAADLNEDGRLDLAVANYASNSTVSILMGNGNGTFQAPVSYATGFASASVAIADFDCDGTLDLAVSTAIINSSVLILLGSPGGTFQAGVSFAVGVNPQFIVARDFDSDGRTDLAVTNGASHTVSILLNTTVTDTDGDGLLDTDETNIYGTDPDNPDSDDDGLLDGTEVDMAAGGDCPDPLDADSDDDTLSDGAEVSLGTDPCNPDSDSDGVGDGVDDQPLVPGVSSGQLESMTRALCDSINALDLSLFNGPNSNANRGRRTSLSNRACNAANAIADDDFDDAIDKLASLLAKVDGTEPEPDWMDPSAEQDTLREDVALLIALLLL